jgi:hypothetical protein
MHLIDLMSQLRDRRGIVSQTMTEFQSFLMSLFAVSNLRPRRDVFSIDPAFIPPLYVYFTFEKEF